MKQVVGNKEERTREVVASWPGTYPKDARMAREWNVSPLQAYHDEKKDTMLFYTRMVLSDMAYSWTRVHERIESYTKGPTTRLQKISEAAQHLLELLYAEQEHAEREALFGTDEIDDGTYNELYPYYKDGVYYNADGFDEGGAFSQEVYNNTHNKYDDVPF